MDRILIEGLRVDTIIGVHDWERDIRQTIVLDIDVGVNIPAAATSDRLCDTVSYGDIARTASSCIDDSRFELIEALAEHVAATLLTTFPIEDIRLKLAKPGAVSNADQVAIVIHRQRT